MRLIVLVGNLVVLGCGGSSPSISATTPTTNTLPSLVNGACGAANGVAAGVISTISLCSAGVASAVLTGTNSYLWSCTGVNGGTTVQCNAPSTTSVSTATQNFANRCAQLGVIKCVGFDSDSDFDRGNLDAAGPYGHNSGIFPPSGTANYTLSTRDTTTMASGNSSLKFTVPAITGADSSGSYFTNFSTDLATQFGENSDLFIQWRQRFSPEFLSTIYAGGGGWKQFIVGSGDQPGKQFSTSCSALEIVVQNLYHRGFPQMYNSCTGSTSHGPYYSFEEPFGTYDFKLQNGMPQPFCLYSQSSTGYFPPVGNCFAYRPNEWMTFQVHIKTGPRVNDEFTGSYVSLWVAREGVTSQQVIAWGPYNLSAGSASDNQLFGKIWLLPYNTGKSALVTNPVSYTWYDELIISRNKIADPM